MTDTSTTQLADTVAELPPADDPGLSVETPVDPAIQKGLDAADAVLDNPVVAAQVDKEVAKIPQKARSVIYEVAQWTGALAAGAATTAAFLDGKPQLVVGTIAGIALFLTNRLAKAHLSGS